MKDRTAKLIADGICWTTLTIAMVAYGYVFAASMVGSFGIIYLYKGIRSLIHIHYVNKRFEAFVRDSEDDV